MIVYEVNLEVDQAIAGDYRAWLDTHVAEILTLPGFTGARLHEVQDPLPTPGRFGLCVQYLLADSAALDGYLREHAPRLRAEGADRFGDGVRVRRRVLVETAVH
jgi:hypothetical protein